MLTSQTWRCWPFQFLHRAKWQSRRCIAFQQHIGRCLHNASVQDGDAVVLKPLNQYHASVLTGQISPSDSPRSTVKTGTGTIPTSQILGKKYGEVVRSTKGAVYTILQPTLADHVTLSWRLVQPIYPTDATTIVSLLDLHPDDRTIGDEGPLEILEAGTGQGALTLYLARAIHGVNDHPAPFRPRMTLPKNAVSNRAPASAVEPGSSQINGHEHEESSQTNTAEIGNNLKTNITPIRLSEKTFEKFDTSSDTVKSAEANPAAPDSSSGDETNSSPQADISDETNRITTSCSSSYIESPEHAAARAAYRHWLDQRRAIIHTIDKSATHSDHARRLIRRYRKGMYLGDIDFHVGCIEDVVNPRLKERPEPFLDHVVLDMPDIVENLETIERALKPCGLLVVFLPNITQVIDVFEAVKNQGLKLRFEKCIELSQGRGEGGRQWDLYRMWGQVSQGTSPEDGTPRHHVVCKPTKGERIVGGGFVGVWRRQHEVEDS